MPIFKDLDAWLVWMVNLLKNYFKALSSYPSLCPRDIFRADMWTWSWYTYNIYDVDAEVRKEHAPLPMSGSIGIN